MIRLLRKQKANTKRHLSYSIFIATGIAVLAAGILAAPLAMGEAAIAQQGPIRILGTFGRTSVRAQQRVRIGEQIKTGGQSIVIGSYPRQDLYFSTQENSSLRLVEEDSCRDGGRISKWVLEGTADFDLRRLFSNPCSRLLIKTSTGTYSIRGTNFLLDQRPGDSSSEEKTILAVSKGKVIQSYSGQNYLIREGEWNSTTQGQPPGPPQKLLPLTYKLASPPADGHALIITPEGNRIFLGKDPKKRRFLGNKAYVPLGVSVGIIGPDGATQIYPPIRLNGSTRSSF